MSCLDTDFSNPGTKGQKIFPFLIFVPNFWISSLYYPSSIRHSMKFLYHITYYFNIAKRNGSLDKGQSVIVDKNKILLREDRKGTDNLILRYKLLNRKDNFSLLVKVCKPKQNIYFDLPTIGPDTIMNIHLSGIKGIIVEKNNSLIANPEETFKLIHK